MIDAFSQVSVTRSRRLEMRGRSGPRWALWMLALSVVSVAAASQGAGRVATRQRDQLVEGQRLEGQAILALADAAMASQRGAVPGRFQDPLAERVPEGAAGHVRSVHPRD